MAIPLEAGVLSSIRELLAKRISDDRPVDMFAVLHWMHLPDERHDELAARMSELLADGRIRGKELRGDGKALDVVATAVVDDARTRPDG
jgi:hypothetical protein